MPGFHTSPVKCTYIQHVNSFCIFPLCCSCQVELYSLLLFSATPSFLSSFFSVLSYGIEIRLYSLARGVKVSNIAWVMLYFCKINDIILFEGNICLLFLIGLSIYTTYIGYLVFIWKLHSSIVLYKAETYLRSAGSTESTIIWSDLTQVRNISYNLIYLWIFIPPIYHFYHLTSLFYHSGV